jgi:hypothetical protein
MALWQRQVRIGENVMSNAWKEAGLSDAELPPHEVELVKAEIMQTPNGLREATKNLQQSYYRRLASIHPRTRTLYKFWTFLGFFNLACLTVFPIAIFILTRWYWALAPIVLNFLIRKIGCLVRFFPPG